jgi:hypothetical protein
LTGKPFFPPWFRKKYQSNRRASLIVRQRAKLAERWLAKQKMDIAT